jgi:hypothetical protein
MGQASQESLSLQLAAGRDMLEVVVDGRPRWRSLHCKSMHSNAELVVRQSLASKDVNTETEEVTVLEAVTRQPVKTAA